MLMVRMIRAPQGTAGKLVTIICALSVVAATGCASVAGSKGVSANPANGASSLNASTHTATTNLLSGTQHTQVGGSTNGTQSPQPPLQSVQMITAKIGWATSMQGGVLRTTDGGANWSDVTPPGLPTITIATARALVPLGVTVARLVATDNGHLTVYSTSTGGARWSQLTSPTLPRTSSWPQVYASFPSTEDGWILATSSPGLGLMATALVHTTDGGQSWTQVGAGTLPQSGMYETGITFNAAGDGVISGTYHGSSLTPLSVTANGGVTWRAETLPMPTGATYLNTYPPAFWGESGLLPAETGSTHDLVFYRTANGGQDWQPLAVPLPGNGASYFIWSMLSPTETFATNGFVVYQTADGGHSVTVKTNTDLQDAWSMDFLTATEGWVIVKGELLRTTNGGITWTPAAQGEQLPPVGSSTTPSGS